MARKKISKSKRIQDYLGSNPEARNREVVEALSTHSVTAADVSNAKSQMKKKQSAPPAEAAAAGSKRGRASATRKSVSQKTTSQISVKELEMTADYIKSVGGLNQAQQLLQMVQQIRAL